jgi:hypothetical protein
LRIEHFIIKSNFSKKTEVEKVKFLAIYFFYHDNLSSFYLNDIFTILKNSGHQISNDSRLKSNIIKSRDFQKRNNNNEFSLTPKAREKLLIETKNIFEDEEKIISSSEVLDEQLFLGKRGYLDKLIKQINNCYINNCFDAASILMRRVFEISLILAYENLGLHDEIKDVHGNYFMLEKIVTNAIKNKQLNISRSRHEYDAIRELGNFAAHKIHFNTRKKDIDDIKLNYRATIEELFYKANLLS